jgi:transposase
MQVGWYDRKICRVRDLSCGDTRIFLELEVRRLDCRNCGRVKRERLDFLADNPHYTKRFAYYVGRRCRSATIKDVAADLRLDWHTVKTLDQQYMQAQLARAGRPGPQVIGIDEIAIRKGHTYRIVVSDLLRGRPIWFGGKDRSEASMSEFYVWLGAKKSGRIRLAVMDMWRPFRLATAAHAPNAAILFTSSMSCAIWARPWMRFARANMDGLRAAIGATSRARNTPCCRARRTSRSTAGRH